MPMPSIFRSSAQRTPLLSPAHRRSDAPEPVAAKLEKPGHPRKSPIAVVFSGCRALARKVKYVASPLGLRADRKAQAATERTHQEVRVLLRALSNGHKSGVDAMQSTMQGRDAEFRKSLAHVLRDMPLGDLQALDRQLASNSDFKNAANKPVATAVTRELWRKEHGKTYLKPTSCADVFGPTSSPALRSDMSRFVNASYQAESFNFLAALEPHFTGGVALDYETFESIRDNFLLVGSAQEQNLNASDDALINLRTMSEGKWNAMAPAAHVAAFSSVRAEVQNLFWTNVTAFLAKPS